MLTLLSRYFPSLLAKRRSSSSKVCSKMTEDVKMVDLCFNEEDLKQEFEAFAVTIELDNKPVVDKLKSLCLINNLSPEDLACEWIAFCSRRSGSNAITMPMLEMFEAEHFRKKVIAVREKQKEDLFEEKLEQKSKFTKLNNKTLEDYGLDTLNTSKVSASAAKQTKSDEKKDENFNFKVDREASLIVKQENSKVAIESPLRNKTSSANEQSLQIDQVTGLPLPDRIDTTYGAELKNEQWTSKSNASMTMKPFNPDFHITEPFKYLQMRRHECNLIMNEAIEDMAEVMIRKLDITGFASLNETEKIDRMFVGRITTDSQDGKVNAKNLYFTSPPYGDGHVRLELNACSTFSLFPGKIVAFNGSFGDEHLAVKEFLDDTVNVPEFSSEPITLKSPLQIISACGPYTLPDSKNLTPLVRLLEHVKMFQPHYLILMGPFFDCRNDFLLINGDCEQFFKIVIEAISTALHNTRTHAIIIPSTFDLNNYSTFPAPPFQCSAPRIHFMPNPSFLNIEGVILSLSSVDIVRHLLRDLAEGGIEEGNRMKRVCSHILTQRSLYPLFPSNSELNLEYSKIDFIKFNTTPHLFILPSMLKTFATEAHSSVFVNPGFLSKGHFARICVTPPPADYSGSLKDYISVEIIKHSNDAN